MRLAVVVEGRGLGAVAVAATLSALGHPVATERTPDPTPGQGPVVTLNEKTLWMLGDLFGPDLIPALCAQGVEVSRRRVRWSGPRIETVPERSLAIETGALALRLARRIPPGRCSGDLIVRARGRRANCGSPVGTLTAFVWNLPSASVSGAGSWSATVSSTRAWVALTPKPGGGLVVQAFCNCGDVVLARRSAIEAMAALGLRVDEAAFGAATVLDAAPRLGRLWVDAVCAMGDEAMTFDPLAGDGVGSAIRSAVWLSALLAADEMPPEMRRRRYDWRMTLAFGDHLRARERFYRAAGSREESRNDLSSRLDRRRGLPTFGLHP